MKKRNERACRIPKAPLLPKETIEIVARRELLLTGVLGIDDYHTERVCIRTSSGAVIAEGASISLCWAGEKRLLLRGIFETIHFEAKKTKRRCES